jgi:hypothetical protein
VRIDAMPVEPVSHATGKQRKPRVFEPRNLTIALHDADR